MWLDTMYTSPYLKMNMRLVRRCPLITMMTVLVSILLVYAYMTSYEQLQFLDSLAEAKVKTSTRSCRGCFNSEFMKDLRNGKLHQEDPTLIQYIYDRVLIEPARRETPYELDKPHKKMYSQIGQDGVIDGLLKQKHNGLFIESGAADGETNSNTLFFERERNWTGLLVEVNPTAFRQLLGKGRKSYLVESCLSPTKNTTEITLTNAGQDTQQLRGNATSAGKSIFTAQCFPMWAIIQALKWTRVDLLSLDIEGLELDILKTLPLNKLQIDILTIEFNRRGDSPKMISHHLDSIKSYILSTGLYMFHKVHRYQDIMFIHKNYTH